MIAVIGAIAIITAVALGGYFVSVNVLGESERVEAESRAFQVAQSGLDRELAVFNPVNIETGYYPRNGTTPDGSYTVDVAPMGSAGFEYVITSTGVSDIGSESVTMRFYYLNLWDMNIGGGEDASIGGGRGFNGNAAITGPFYVRGDFEWTSNAAYEGGPLFIRDGRLNVTGSGELGKAKPIRLYSTQGIAGKVGNVYLDGPVSSSVPDIQLPWITEEDMDRYYDLAINESKDDLLGYQRNSMSNVETADTNGDGTGDGDPSTYTTVVSRNKAPSSPVASSQYYKYIGPAAGRSAMGAGSTFVEIDNVSFGEWDRIGSVYENTGKHDDFAYDVGTGTLYVAGTIFIDGDLHLGQNVQRYEGNGTIVVNGDVFIGGNLRPRDGVVSAEQCLGIVTPGDVVIGDNAHSGSVQASMTGVIFANGQVSLYHTQSSYQGSILASNIYGDKPNITLTTIPNIAQSIPDSMPAAGGGLVFSGQWTRN